MRVYEPIISQELPNGDLESSTLSHSLLETRYRYANDTCALVAHYYIFSNTLLSDAATGGPKLLERFSRSLEACNCGKILKDSVICLELYIMYNHGHKDRNA